MSCDSNTKTLLACIRKVCATATSHTSTLEDLRTEARELEQAFIDAQSKLDCVLNGAAGTNCDGLPTLAGALAALNACTITSIAVDTTTATGGQTSWTLEGAANGLDVALNGAHLQPSTDYAWSGSPVQVTFTEPLTAGDELTAWRYSV
jgi:hypothetical protein